MLSSISLGNHPGVPAPLPRLDAASIDHDLRHGAILGALESAPRGMELTAPHDPERLLAQIEARWPGQFAVEYLERDTAWRLAITRRANETA